MKTLKFTIIILLICINSLNAQIDFSIDSVIINRNHKMNPDIEIMAKAPSIKFYCEIQNNTDSLIDLDFGNTNRQLYYSFNYKGKQYFSELLVIDLLYKENISIQPFTKFNFDFNADIFGKHDLLSNDISTEEYFEFLSETLPTLRLGLINGKTNIESKGINNVIIAE